MNTDINAQPQSSNVEMNISTAEKKLTGKEKRLLNLRPIKPGEVRNPTGKRGLLIKDRITKKLNAKRADNVAENIILQSEQGIIESQKLLLKLTGDLDDKPQVNIQNNSFTISDEMIQAAQEFIKNKENPPIDV